MSLALSDHQLRNARGIIAAVKKRGWSAKAAVIAIETVLTESNMCMIASANVPASQRYPHVRLSWTSDGMGHDHASMGMYQQQTGYAWTPAGYGRNMNQTTMDSPDGWGTPAELMDPEKSTEKFLNELAHHPWATMDNWMAAQSVQVSAFPDGSNYRQNDSYAHTIVNALWSAVSPTPKNDWMAELMGLYDGHKLTPAEQREKANFEKAMQSIVWSQVRRPFLSDDGKWSHRVGWHLRRLVPGARPGDGTGK